MTCNFQIHSVSLTIVVSIHLLIHLSTHLCHHPHSRHPYSFTLSLQAQNLPFQQILSTVDFFNLLECLTITGLDRTGPITLIILFLVLRFNFLFVPCGRLSWLPVSFLLHVKHTLSYRCIWDTWISELFGFDVLFELVSVIIWVLYLATCVRNWLQLSSWIFQIRCAVALESWV